jgi:hypothetical protein
MSRSLQSKHVRTAPYTIPGPPMSNLASPADVASRRGMAWNRQGDIHRRRPRRRTLSRRLRVDLILARN